jgi:hypothetical protein
MTSQKVMLMAAGLLLLGGCSVFKPPPSELDSPYATRRAWAVMPLYNESGSAHADGMRMADRLAQQIDAARNLDAVPVNRVLAAMHAAGIAEVRDPQTAASLIRTLGVDGLVVGSITAYDPYDPPMMGVALELYTSEAVERYEMDLTRLTRAATEDAAGLPQQEREPQHTQPVSMVSVVLRAADLPTRRELERYAEGRGPQKGPPSDWRRHRINMNLYQEFVAFAMVDRLLRAERHRLEQARTAHVSP